MTLLTTAQAAERLGVSPRTLRYWRDKRIPAIAGAARTIPGTRFLRWDSDAIDAIAQGHSDTQHVGDGRDA